MHAAAQLARYIVGRHTVRAIVCSLLIPLICDVHARSQSPATASPPATVSSNASSNAAESIPAYPATTTPTYPHPAAAPSPWVPFETTVPPAYNYPRVATELTRHGDYMPGAVVPVAAQEEIPAPEEIQPLPMIEDAYGEMILGMTCAGCDGGNCSGCGGCIGGCQSCGSPNTSKTHFGRFFHGVYHGMCCPDPCYEPKWRPIADSAFFVDSPRPMTQTRLRWDSGFMMTRPDIGEFYWARADGAGLGPAPPAGQLGTSFLDFQEIKVYNEIANGGFGVIMEFPYRSLDIDGTERVGGFGDMVIGTKSMMVDSELVQWSLVFRTFIPIGVPLQGLGTGHVSLEPAIVMAINLAPETYLQAEIAERIPIGGDPEYSGGVLHYHLSLNHTLLQPIPSMPIIATLEANGYTFHEGAYTDPTLGTRLANKQTYVSVGPGLRVFICDRMDFGIGSAFALSQEHLAEYWLRSEVRLRF